MAMALAVVFVIFYVCAAATNSKEGRNRGSACPMHSSTPIALVCMCVLVCICVCCIVPVELHGWCWGSALFQVFFFLRAKDCPCL